MKREEKNRKSSQELLHAAMAEFGTRDYGEVTLNSICNRHNISKGLFYHYCNSKDEVFLRCVQQTFTGLAEYLQRSVAVEGDLEKNINAYFDARREYFTQNPLEKRIFASATFQCPAHLQEQIASLRAPLREWNRCFIRQVFSRLELRPGISLEEAERYFSLFGEIFSYLLGQYRKEGVSFPEMEQETRRILDMMLYGIARPKMGA